MSNYKRLLKASLFVVSVSVSVFFLTQLFLPKDEMEIFQLARAPYYEKDQSLDVVFIGSSHIIWGIDPNYIWDKYGIPSINYGFTQLDLTNTYFLMTELFKRHRPKVLVIDAYRLHTEDPTLTRRIANAFPLSRNKVNLINENKDIKGFDALFEYYFPLSYYHSTKLKSNNFTFRYDNMMRGHCFSFAKTDKPFLMQEASDTLSLTAEDQTIVNRIISLAKQNNVALVFIKTPFLKANADLKKEWNAIELIAKSQDIPFVNFNKDSVFRACGIIQNEDINDDSETNCHMNQFGSEKISRYITEFIQRKYSLKNRKRETQFAFLDRNLIEYKKELTRQNPYEKSDRIESGKELLAGENIISTNKRYKLILQHDGNLVLYKDNSTTLWASNTSGNSIHKCLMQGDGNLVLYDKNSKPFWSSNTYGHTSTYLVIQNDGNLVIYEGEKPIWSSNTLQM